MRLIVPPPGSNGTAPAVRPPRPAPAAPTRPTRVTRLAVPAALAVLALLASACGGPAPSGALRADSAAATPAASGTAGAAGETGAAGGSDQGAEAADPGSPRPAVDPAASQAVAGSAPIQSGGTTTSTGGRDPGATATTRVTTTTRVLTSETSSSRSTTTVGSDVSGVYGTVTSGPSCPVETPDRPCPDRPLSIRVEARDRAGQLAATTASDANGHYVLHLAPGPYTISATAGAPLPRCLAVSALVPASPLVRADIGCDSGIR